MRSLSSAIQVLLGSNSFVQFGLSQGILNLTKTAEMLQPLLESTLQKEVSVSAIKMQLSREQKRLEQYVGSMNDVHLNTVSIINGLCLLSFDKSKHILHAANTLNDLIQGEGESLTMTQGISELTVILPKTFLPQAKELFGTTPKYAKEQLSGVSVSFDHSYTQDHGLIFSLVQAIELQAINIVEIASTHSELIFYVDPAHAKAVFSTFQDGFTA